MWNQWPPGLVNSSPNTAVGVGGLTSGPGTNQISFNSNMPQTGYPASQFSGMTSEQQFAMQQNWQQWQSYQQQYAQWHAQYGEQYKREMEVKLGTAPPSLPFPPNPAITGAMSQYTRIVNPANLYSAPPPPPEIDIRRSNDLLNSQPPPPPPPENTNDDNVKRTSSFFPQKSEQHFDSNSTKLFDYNDTQMSNKHSQQFTSNEIKSREEEIFDEQFKKWEEEFENWKKANINHPDKKAYRDYEIKFEDCRRKLIERRTQMRRKKNVLQNEDVSKKELEQKWCKDKDPNLNVLSESKNVEETTKYLEPQTKNNESGIPGLDLLKSNEKDVKKIDESLNNIENIEIIDLDNPNENNSPSKIRKNDETKKNERSRWSNTLNNENRNSVNSPKKNVEFQNNFGKHLETPAIIGTQMNSKQIPSLLDQLIEKPNFSPVRENYVTHELTGKENLNKIDFQPKDKLSSLIESDGLKPHTAQIENETNIQNLASALADPNVMALLNAALKTQDQVFNDNKLEQGNNVPNQRFGHLRSENDQMFYQNDGSEHFREDNSSKQNMAPNRMNENYNSEQSRNQSRNQGENLNIWNQGSNDWMNKNYNNMDNNFRNNQQNNWNNFQRGGGRGDGINFEDQWNRNSGMEQNRDERKGGFNQNKGNKRRNKNNRNNRNSSALSNNRDGSFHQNVEAFNQKQQNPFNNNNNNFDREDEYFRPTHVIDYQNKSLPENVLDINTDKNIIPKKIVDYGHKPSTLKLNDSLETTSNEFIPMKTIDYDHASSKKDIQPIKKQSFGDFLAIRTNNLNNKRKGDDDIDGDDGDDEKQGCEKKKKYSIIEESNSTYPGPWTFLNIENRNRPNFPTKRGKRKKSKKTNNNFNSEINSSNNSSKDIFDEISDLENSYDESDLISIHDDSPKEENNSIKNLHKVPFNGTNNNPNILNNQNSFVQNVNDNFCIENMSFPTFENKNTVLIDEIMLKPGRFSRPKKITIILRGPPGSGKSYIAKLIKEKETELNGTSVRLLSIDDYFVVEIDKIEKCPNSGRQLIKKELEYVYESKMESIYLDCLIKSFKKTLSENLFDFVIVDCGNYSLRTFTEFYNTAKAANYTPYTIDMFCDFEKCIKQNIHNRSDDDIKEILSKWNETPNHYIKLDITNITESFAKKNEEKIDVPNEDDEKSSVQLITSDSDSNDSQETSLQTTGFFKSKWDTNASISNLARLDGINKSFHTKSTIEDYLQADGWEPPPSNSPSNSNKKRVRWADIEERREQDKMRAIGFVVGQTDWNRMLDPTFGRSALTKTKFIEKVKKK